MSQELTQRKGYLDFLRCMACIAVIQLHVSASNWYSADIHSFSWQVLNFFDAIVRWAVPIFLMISGTLFLNPQKEITIKNIWQKYIFRIVVAIVFFGLLIFLILYLPASIIAHKNILLNIKDFIDCLHFYHLWYLYVIMGIYMIVPLLRLITLHATKKQLEYFMLILCLFTIVISPLKYIFPGNAITLVADIIQFPILSGYLLCFLLGSYLDRYDFKYKKWLYIMGGLSILATILGTSCLSIWKNSPIDILYGYLTPNCVCASMAIFVFIKDAYSKFKNQVNRLKIFGIISKYALGIYGVHVIFIALLTQLGITTITFNPIIMVPCITILVLLLSVIFVFVLCKVPFIKRFIV
ncbi:MAG: acyltransferase family protein [Bacteroidales bacterium]|jgi:surface polysaccharide O-acyltransferase-like enzyme|nr:acyltransferase family protein [Bacteroidales bacterium]